MSYDAELAQAYQRIQALEQQNAALERALADLVEYCTTGDEGRVEALGRARILVGNKNFPEARTDEQRSQDVQKLVDAAQPFVEVLHSHPAAVGTFTVHATAEQWEALAEALKPFEQEKR